LNKRKQSGRTKSVIYGVHPVRETLSAGRRRVEEIFLVRGSLRESESAFRGLGPRIHIRECFAAELAELVGTPHHQGVAARVGPFPYVGLDRIVRPDTAGPRLVVVLDEVQDPSNLGSIVRSAECLGATAVILARDRSASVTPAVEKASSGATAHLPIARVVNLARTIEELKRSGFWVFAADPHGREPCYGMDLTGDLALVLGSEERGVRRLVRERSDGLISIPLYGRIDSLNVSQTAAILLSEVRRQRMERENRTD
jgi:23S rRNA (guanosine2251-2'-O)-methyltransferase